MTTEIPNSITMYICKDCGLRSTTSIGFHRDGHVPGGQGLHWWGKECKGEVGMYVYQLDALKTAGRDELLSELGRRDRTVYVSAIKACKAIFDWLDCIKAEHLEPGDKFFRDEQLHEIAKLWDEHAFRIRLASSKSALLNRTFYGDGEVRPTKCPKHKGHWWGIGSPQDCDCVDEYGNATGWIK